MQYNTWYHHDVKLASFDLEYGEGFGKIKGYYMGCELIGEGGCVCANE